MPRLRQVSLALTAFFFLLAVGACASPAQRWWHHVAKTGFNVTVVPGEGFRHVILDKPGRPSRVLHVYVDGDGSPWAGGSPTTDPTPRSTLVLDLMARDQAPSLYLGRPCYHGFGDDPGCTPALWTSQRYSHAVVTSMAAGLARLLAVRPFDRVAWIGYSGGGTLAVLLAPRLPQSAAVVTVAANLDIDAWAAYHRYLPLAGSLNPARQPRLSAALYQRHYVGGRDRVVPPDIIAPGPMDASTIVTIPDFDHRCCWQRLWPALVGDLVRATTRTD